MLIRWLLAGLSALCSEVNVIEKHISVMNSDESWMVNRKTQLTRITSQFRIYKYIKIHLPN